ncbi:hypothetical protein Q4543_17765 [Salipiger sp. 1_MG-2023]|uniref:hypothetical protein n=1 Tax=Salipiger sp. 1_MG-2023 TaxID=3062665 RepID=UPI0026E3F132|nr:hypothetical protein [Salipiger sp. 1_MG-2023]MDO6587363.1 hypothetical protein [Salipiger sp. 1_MG-2023]
MIHPLMMRDDFGIGQAAAARIAMQIASETMRERVVDAFATGWVNPQWRAMSRERFDAARAEYAAAAKVQEAWT